MMETLLFMVPFVWRGLCNHFLHIFNY